MKHQPCAEHQGAHCEACEQVWPCRIELLARLSRRDKYDYLAKPVTIDAAWARAYRDIRALLLEQIGFEPEGEYRTGLLNAVETIATRLEKSLADLLYGDEEATRLARPE